MKRGLAFSVLAVGLAGSVYACGSKSTDNGFTNPGGDGGAGDNDGAIVGSDGGLGGSDGGTTGDGGSIVGDPKDCNEAKTSKSYVGCDYYPTVTANGVWQIFDYAVVVSNTSTTAADITVTGGTLGAATNVTVQPNELKTIYLPWVPALKGGDADNCGQPPPIAASVIAPGGAYHLVSTAPVVVYQFNALEYKGAGGPAGKDWSGANCPGNVNCSTNDDMPVGCFSFSNDATLLLPSTAMTGNYRVSGHQAVGSTTSGSNTFFTVTATQDNTTVITSLPAKGNGLASAGAGIPTPTGGSSLTFVLAHAGDVGEVFGKIGNASDFSGALVQGDKPIQVISGVSALTIPESNGYADHTEETVLPVETLGKHYVIPMPDKPGGGGIGVGTIRFYGNQDSTTLTYNGGAPKGCPTSINAGEMKECTVGSVNIFSGKVTSSNVEVTGDKEFGVALFQQGSTVYGTAGTNSKGDPAESVIASAEQFRLKYLFLAPNDYDESYADIVGPSDAAPVVDGTPVSAAPATVGSGPYAVWRVKLGTGPKGDGAHTLTSSQPVGVQVVGYGDYTSYQYPGGLNLNLITAPPPPPR